MKQTIAAAACAAACLAASAAGAADAAGPANPFGLVYEGAITENAAGKVNINSTTL